MRKKNTTTSVVAVATSSESSPKAPTTENASLSRANSLKKKAVIVTETPPDADSDADSTTSSSTAPPARTTRERLTHFRHRTAALWSTMMRKATAEDGRFAVWWSAFMLVVLLYNCTAAPFRAAFLVDPVPPIDNSTAPANSTGSAFLLSSAWMASGLQSSASEGVYADTERWFVAVDVVTDICLMADIVMHFHRPFFDDDTGSRIDDFARTRRRYLRGYFAVDFIASLPVELLYAIPSLGVRPVFRLVRMLRLTRINQYFKALERPLLQHTTSVRLSKFLVILALISHGMACGFFAVVHSEGRDPLTGESVARDWTSSPHMLDQGVGEQYLQALYYSVMCLSGYGGHMPLTDAEHGYALLAAFIGFIVNAVVIGTVGTLVENLDASGALLQQKMDAVTEYLQYRRVEPRLKAKVRQYYSYLLKSRNGLDESRVLADLPPHLREEVALWLNKDIIQKVPLFHGVDRAFIGAVVALLKPRISLPHTFIVRKDELGSEMFFISRGTVDILADDDETVRVSLHDGMFFGEIALLFDTRRTASVRTATYCDLFVLTKTDFDSVLAEFPSQWQLIKHTAEQRYQALQLERKQTAIKLGVGVVPPPAISDVQSDEDDEDDVESEILISPSNRT